MPSPSTQPPPAVIRLILIVSQYWSRYGWCTIARMWSNVAPPCALLKAPTTTSPAGMKRNASAYAKKGSSPSHARERRLRPERASGRSALGASARAASCPSDRRPLGRDLRLCRRLLRGARELHLRVDLGGRQRLEERRRDLLPPRQVLEARGMRIPLEPEQLPLVGVQELHPQPSRVRVRRESADRLAVERSVDAVGRDHGPPVHGRELLPVGEVQVVPVDDDRRLAGSDRLRSPIHRDEIPSLLELSEEVDPGTHVVERAAVRKGRGEDPGDCRVRRERVAVQRNSVLVGRLQEIFERLRGR